MIPSASAEPLGTSKFSSLRNNWSATLQSSVAQTMQLSLGGTFNQGPAQQNRLTLTGTGLFRRRDTLQFYGWNTTDLRTGNTDADMGIRYRAPVAKLAQGSLIAGTGVEYWYFPSVLGGTRDVVLDTYMAWSGGEKIPITISGNGKTLLRSRLPLGSMGIFQVQHTQKIARWNSNLLSVNHGPMYVYSWDLYGRPGNRVFRYSAAVQLSRGRWALEGTFRPQAGLQDRIPDNKFWCISVIRKLW